jgi:hypothetical protein
MMNVQVSAIIERRYWALCHRGIRWSGGMKMSRIATTGAAPSELNDRRGPRSAAHRARPAYHAFA